MVISERGFITGYTVTKPNIEREASFECVAGLSGLIEESKIETAISKMVI